MAPSSTNSSFRGSLIRLSTSHVTRSPTVAGWPPPLSSDVVRGSDTLCFETLSKRISRPPLEVVLVMRCGIGVTGRGYVRELN